MEHKKLRPCPFCGNEEMFDNYLAEMSPGRWCVECPDCEAGGPVMSSKEDAIEMWNYGNPRSEEDDDED